MPGERGNAFVGTTAAAPDRLLERDRALRAIEAAIDEAAAGRGTLLALFGCRGQGRSALLEAAGALAAARGARHMRGLPGIEAASTDRERLELACRALVTAAERSPVVITIDDLERLARDDLRLLDFIARRVERLPVAIVAAANELALLDVAPETVRLIDDVRADAVTLEPLSRDAIAALLHSAAGDAASADDVVAEVERLTGGVPAYARSAAAALEGVVEPMPPAGIEGLCAAALAPEIERTVARDGLAAVRLARALAVLGPRVELRDAGLLAGLPDQQLPRAARELTAAGYLRSGAQPAFTVPLAAAALREAVPAKERELLELRAADLKLSRNPDGCEDIDHLLAVSPSGSTVHARRLHDAGRRATAAGEYELAVSALRGALAEEPPRGLRREVLVALGAAEVFLDPASARMVVLEAGELSADPDERAEIALALASQTMLTAGVAKAVDDLEAALANLGSDARIGEHLLARRWILGHFNYDVRVRLLRDEKRPGPHAPFLGAAIRAHDAAVYDGTAAAAIGLARRALAELPRAPRLVEESAERNHPDMALMYAGDLVTAEDDLTDQIGAARARGSREAAAIAIGIRAGVRLRRGNIRQALADLGALDELPVNLRLMIGLKGVFLVDALRETGRLDQAMSHLTMLESLGRAEDSVGINLHLEARGLLHRDRGELEEALAIFKMIGERDRRWGIEIPGMTSWRAHATEVLARLGRTGEARRLGTDAVERARRFGSPIALGIALRAQGLAIGGEEGSALLRSSVAALRASPARLELARSLVELGMADPTAAAALDEGARLASACGAVALQRRILAHRNGGRLNGSDPAPGASSVELSRSEAAVVELAIRGLRNRQIAAQLGLSEKTIEAHLSRTYLKLRIGSREELAGALAARREATTPPA